MSDTSNPVLRPLEIVHKIFEACVVEYADNADVAANFVEKSIFEEIIENGNFTLPRLTRNSLDSIPVDSFVSYRGIIQDIFNTEFYCASGSDPVSGLVHSFKYRDAITTYDTDSGLDFDIESDIHILERQPIMCIPVPGESNWSKQLFTPKTATIPYTIMPNQKSKKRLYPDGQSMVDSPQLAADEHEEDMPTKSKKSSDDLRKKSALSEQPSLADFMVENDCCLVKVYGNMTDGLRLNDIVEFVGIYTADLDGDGVNSCGVFDDFDEFEDPVGDRNAHIPPPSLAPRLHCISYRKLGSSFPLLLQVTGPCIADPPVHGIVELSRRLWEELGLGPLCSSSQAAEPSTKRRAEEKGVDDSTYTLSLQAPSLFSKSLLCGVRTTASVTAATTPAAQSSAMGFAGLESAAQESESMKASESFEASDSFYCLQDLGGLPSIPTGGIVDEVVELLSEALEGDRLAAEYVALALLSRLYDCRDDEAVSDSVLLGYLPINLCGFSSRDPRKEALIEAIASIVPRLVQVRCDVAALNEESAVCLLPERSASSDKMSITPLQAAAGSVLILDETAMTAATLSAKGSKSLLALSSVVLNQRLPLHFAYCQLQVPTDMPVIIISDKPSAYFGDRPEVVRVTISSHHGSIGIDSGGGIGGGSDIAHSMGAAPGRKQAAGTTVASGRLHQGERGGLSISAAQFGGAISVAAADLEAEADRSVVDMESDAATDFDPTSKAACDSDHSREAGGGGGAAAGADALSAGSAQQMSEAAEAGAMHEEVFHGANGDLLFRLRLWWARMRLLAVDVPAEMAALAEEEFCAARRSQRDVNEDGGAAKMVEDGECIAAKVASHANGQDDLNVSATDFHTWLTVSRLVAISWGDQILSPEHWKHMRSLEIRRVERNAF